ncbi:hypothetical protein NQU59_08180 [Acinetobacter colistiniresistens]|uniref:hypothetical protein n=1 Tax=Acinetobacter colistiniresistens TaxID=280145 RepID=UPI00211B8EB7|nr:hypothetical protein [Acinetobacter colistiniresistens]UUM29043.1 hypothetical protein NQU59_08180 [Acinetobacter colistiniresistens]
MHETNEKQAFSLRLKEALSNHPWAKTSPTWLAREFNLRYSGKSVSVQTANNWLLGLAIPSQDKLQLLAAWLEVSSQWLRFGDASVEISHPETVHSGIQLTQIDLPEKFAQLSPKQKQLVYELINALLDTNPV